MLKILCNVSLVLAGKDSAKKIKLASVDVTERVCLKSNRLDELDASCIGVCWQVVQEFAEEYDLDQTELSTLVTIRVW